MRLSITRLHLVNFKGQRDLEINFNPDVTTISADNGVGKSTISAAFNWLFTGKDQFDSADINKIKTWDASKRHIEKINHSVEAELLINGHQQLTLKRVLVQNWVKRRGETETVLDGHKTEYYINGVGCGTETAFKTEINKLFSEKTFKLLTNPLYFNEILEWKDRREILFSIVPPITDDQVVKLITNDRNESRIVALNKILNSGASFEQYKKELAARKKQKNEQLTLIPAKIDATERAKPEEPDGGFAIVEHQINKIQSELDAIDLQLSDKSKANEAELTKKRERQQFVHNLKTALQKARNAAQTKRQEERNDILDQIAKLDIALKEAQRKFDSLQSDINSNTKEIDYITKSKEFAEKQHPALQEQREKLISEFYEVDALQFHFNPDECTCPTCNTPLQGENLDAKRAELEENFNRDKSKKIEAIEFSGKQIKSDIDKYEEKLKNFDTQIADLEEKNLAIAEKQAAIQHGLSTLQERRTKAGIMLTNFDAETRSETDEEKALLEQITEAEHSDSEEGESSDNPNELLIADKKAKQGEIDALKNILAGKGQIEVSNKLIEEYKEEERKLAQEVADIEGDEDIMNEFARTRIESIEKQVNSLFQLVSFKLFDKKLNGEEKECCEAIEPNGTPVNDTNTAMKVNCGLDVINVLSRHFNISLPIIIDNRESISEIIPVDTQVINLEKVKGQKSLKIE